MAEQFRVGLKARIFNASLKSAIRAKGWTYAEAASELGIHVTTLYLYLAFKAYPSEDRRLRCAIVLGVPDDVLFPEHIAGIRLRKSAPELTFTREEAEVAGLLDGRDERPEVAAEQAALTEAVAATLKSLKRASTTGARMVKVLEYRFGLNGGAPHTLDETGAVFGVHRERVRQIETRALRMLRHPTRSKALREFLVQPPDTTPPKPPKPPKPPEPQKATMHPSWRRWPQPPTQATIAPYIPVTTTEEEQDSILWGIIRRIFDKRGPPGIGSFGGFPK